MTEKKEDKTYDLEERLKEKIPMIGYQDRINRMVFNFKEIKTKRFHPSTFDIQYSIFCGSLFLTRFRRVRTRRFEFDL